MPCTTVRTPARPRLSLRPLRSRAHSSAHELRPLRREADGVGASPARRRSSRLLGTVLAFVLGTTAVLAGAGPAAAHDRLVSSDPENGATLTAAPSAVTLTFTDEIIADGSFARLSVDGAEVGDLPVTVDGAVVTAALPAALADGAYAVTWQVTSSDGHGISDTLTFTLATGPATAPADAADPAVSPTPPEAAAPAEDPASGDPAADDATAEPAAEPAAAETSDPDGPDLGTAVLWILLAAGVLGGVAVLLARRGGGGFDLRNGPPGQH